MVHNCAQDDETGYAATCVEFPEANGQGESVEECLSDLRTAVEAILDYRRDEAARSLGRGDRLELLKG